MFEEIRPLQLKQLELLKELHRVCEAHNLTYYLAFGTLIGAARHKGFIPWDDDVDVVMPYQDWIKLEIEYKDEFRAPYFLQSRRTDRNYEYVCNKFRDSSTTLILKTTQDRDMNHGICMDVYPMYSLADGVIKRSVQYLNTMLYMQLVVNKPAQNHGVLLAFAGKVLLALLGGGDREKKIEKYHSRVYKYCGQETEYQYVLTGSPRGALFKYPSRVFKDKVMLPFEDAEFSAPVGYDEYLTLRYGDYMQMPPVVQQGVKLDNIVKLDLDRPYTDYKGTLYCKNAVAGENS